MWISDDNYCWNRDRSKIVKEDDPEAAFVLICKGQEMPENEARELGLLRDATEPADEPVEAMEESKSETAPAENKAELEPPETQADPGPTQTKSKKK